ncbi:MAG: hypothetical protein JWR89_3751 [Tardiphaga sp.]|uniref:nuclear transport factor 2 family protein n=1 Tax=Tardiphaga sp. TaxID=1926292 RepID=UPI00261E3D44|nr:nuclear transport factor 2 family protein [Tardiphaga sp.]MDB5503849.1 hypothetical protein [Tardiphaga sp.]
MSDETANVDLLKETYRRWSETRGENAEVFMDLADANIQFGSIPRGAAPLTFAKAYDCRDALREYFDGLHAGWTMVHYTIDEFIAQGDVVVARGTCAWKNRRTGKVAESPKVDFWRFRNGKAIEFYEYFDTAHVAAAAA